MTLTIAPDLTTLADLGDEWRVVATTCGPNRFWRGDLFLREIRDRYREMVADGRIVVVQCRGTPSGDLVFAKIAKGRRKYQPRVED
jgi:hypothetical protein